MNPWKTLSSKKIYSNAWMSLREDQVITPNGTEGIYGVVETRIATGVIALTDKDEIVLVGQYRYPTDMYSWELVEGGTDEDEVPLDAIKRELLEEAGIEATNWRPLGSEFHLSNCISSEKAFLFVATELKEGSARPDETEDLKVKKVKVSEALEMVLSGEIKDAMSVMGILLFARERGL